MRTRKTTQGAQQHPEESRPPKATRKRKPKKVSEAKEEEEEGEEKPAAAAEEEEEGRHDIIRINRAPVLTLWVAVVAEREGYKFVEGLSSGKAIAGLFALSKGRRLQLYEEDDKEKAEARKRKRKEMGLEKLPVFGMSVFGKTTEGGLRFAVSQGKIINPSSVEAYLRRSFGSNYDRVKDVMSELAKSYSPSEIGEVAYSLYEKIRPNVPTGVKGWGAKGVLELDKIKSLAGRIDDKVSK